MFTMNDVIDSFKNIFSVNKNGNNKNKMGKGLKLLIILGFAGIILIFISDMFSSDKKTDLNTSEQITYDTSDYQQEMEEKLMSILSKVRGVGNVSVMLTVQSTEEYVYAEEVKSSKNYTTQSGEDANQTTDIENQNSYVIVDAGGEKKPLVLKVLKPEVKGVVIVCEGGSNAAVCENIYKTVSTVLGIPTNKIFVTTAK